MPKTENLRLENMLVIFARKQTKRLFINYPSFARPMPIWLGCLSIWKICNDSWDAASSLRNLFLFLVVKEYILVQVSFLENIILERKRREIAGKFKNLCIKSIWKKIQWNFYHRIHCDWCIPTFLFFKGIYNPFIF